MNKKLFWILSLTWGLLTTIVGLISMVFFRMLSNGTISVSNGFIICRMKNRRFGLSIGPVVFVSKPELINHETGHSIQNAMMGPFFILLVAIPSVIRYWYRHSHDVSTKYDDVWFEGMATALGNFSFVRVNNCQYIDKDYSKVIVRFIPSKMSYSQAKEDYKRLEAIFGKDKVVAIPFDEDRMIIEVEK